MPKNPFNHTTTSDQRVERRLGNPSRQSSHEQFRGTAHVQRDTQTAAMQAAMDAAEKAMTPEAAADIWQRERDKSREDKVKDGFWAEGPVPNPIDKTNVEQLMQLRFIADQRRAIEAEYNPMQNKARREGTQRVSDMPQDAGSSLSQPPAPELKPTSGQEAMGFQSTPEGNAEPQKPKKGRVKQGNKQIIFSHSSSGRRNLRS